MIGQPLVCTILVLSIMMVGVSLANPISECSNPSHVFVLRNNGEYACVTERTAERTGWEIIPTFNDRIVPNPTGYWVPIKDPDAFAALITNAAGDTLLENQEYFYKTELGRLYISDEFTVAMQVFANVRYVLDVPGDEDDFEEYVEDFLANMGIEYDELHYQDMGRGGKIYSISNDYNTISFRFYYYPTTLVHGNTSYDNSLHIKFNGWTNNPELVPTEFPLSKADAIIKVKTFAAENDELNKPARIERGYDGMCNFAFKEEVGEWTSEGITILKEPYLDWENAATDEDVSLVIVGGIPHYIINVGMCTFDPFANGHMKKPVFLIDAYDGQNIRLLFIGGLD